MKRQGSGVGGRGLGKKISVVRAAREFAELYNTGIPWPTLFGILGMVSWKTMEKWIGLLEKGNHDFAALAPHYGEHVRDTCKVTSQESEQLLRFALHPNRLRLSQITRAAKSVMEKTGIPSLSSESTLRRWLIQYKNHNYDKWIFCREGEKALLDKVLPYIERDDKKLAVGDVFVADGHTLNFRVINPRTGKPARATLLLWYDWASRYPAGWQIMMTENTQCIHAALRRAILALGKVPRYAYLDNGRAFRAKFFTKKFDEIGFEGLYSRLGIETIFAAPYNARSKPVERFFGTFNELERLLPSYTGRSIEDKPAWMHRNEKLHQRLHNEYTPTIPEADAAIGAWNMQEYVRRPHRGIENQRPIDLWNRGKGSGVDEAALHYLMLSMELKSVGRNGVTINGIHYYDEALYGLKEKVLVRYDIHDDRQVYIYDQSGRYFLCEATPVRKVHPLAKMTGNILDIEAVQGEIKKQRRLKKSTIGEARKAAENMAPWIAPPETPKEIALRTPLSPAAVADIRAEVAKTEVIHLDEQPKAVLAEWTGDVYEGLIRKRAGGCPLDEKEQKTVAEFEATNEYRMLRDYYTGIEEQAAETGDRKQETAI
ncbi:MAG: transposase, partial [Deltaproteobacteria bacterium]|nr:transposase [Deltaproteobacteria bacterium]